MGAMHAPGQVERLKAFKAERDQMSLDKRGWGRSAPDWVYWQGCNARYDRMLKLVEAEAEVPLAIANAFRNNTLGIMDYYRLRNVQADTDMRTSIAATVRPSSFTRM